MKTKKLIVVLLFQMCGIAFGQDSTKSPTIYIPKNLADAHEQLILLLPDSVKAEMLSDKDSTFIGYHFGIGMWIRNNWGLWARSRLATYFDSLGIHQPDEMSGFILETFWFRLHEKPIPFDAKLRATLRRSLRWKTGIAIGNSSCPIDNWQINFRGFLSERESSSQIISYGSCGKGHLWAYEVGKLLFEPDDALTQEIQAEETNRNVELKERKRQYPLISDLEDLLSRTCEQNVHSISKAHIDSLLILFLSYKALIERLDDSTNVQVYPPPPEDTLVTCALIKIADAAKNNVNCMRALFKLGETSERVLHRSEFVSTLAAGAVYKNPKGFVDLWAKFSPQERENTLSTLVPWENKGLIKLFDDFARKATDSRMRSLAKTIAKSLRVEAE